MTDDEVARQTDSGDLDSGSASDLDIHDRQQDRQTATPREHEVEHRVAGIVVVLSIADESVNGADDLSAGKRVRLRHPVRLLSGTRELRTEDVEPSHRAGSVDVTELRCQSERQDI